MSLDSGSAVPRVCLHPFFVRLTASANNKKRRAADSERGDKCQATGGRIVFFFSFFFVEVKAELTQTGRAGMTALLGGTAAGTQLSEAWHSEGPALAPL